MFSLFLFFLLIQSFLIGPQANCKEHKVHISGLKKILDNFHSVEPGICYRSAQLRPKTLARYIKKYGIKSVINLRGENAHSDWWKAEKMVSEELGVTYYNLPFCAKKLEKKHDLKALLHIYKIAPRPILIHCLSGADRTGEAAALWVLEQQGKSKKEALKQLSLYYRYFRLKRPKKFFLIKHWSGIKNFNCPDAVS
ncbi:MAG: hypothetical protein US49_C0001G0015 [candidate division TM6 bacterium GW2011_GWF2_37_49]|nr:MAG: hypothetical protein US49_C0001G0015 [candidate division TM6 bacterium GW2011_GWF2_37_49]